MENAGSALMGIGYGSGENRAVDAARSAVESPLLELSINGAKGLLLSITGGTDLSMFEIDEAARMITESCDPNANIIFGTSIDEKYTGEIKITVIATGFSEETNAYMTRGAMGQNSIFGRNTGVNHNPKPAFESHNISRNAFGANQMSHQGSTMPPQQQPQAQNDYDVPAFLRNKMK